MIQEEWTPDPLRMRFCSLLSCLVLPVVMGLIRPFFFISSINLLSIDFHIFFMNKKSKLPLCNSFCFLFFFFLVILCCCNSSTCFISFSPNVVLHSSTVSLNCIFSFQHFFPFSTFSFYSLSLLLRSKDDDLPFFPFSFFLPFASVDVASQCHRNGRRKNSFTMLYNFFFQVGCTRLFKPQLWPFCPSSPSIHLFIIWNLLVRNPVSFDFIYRVHNYQKCQSSNVIFCNIYSGQDSKEMTPMRILW